MDRVLIEEMFPCWYSLDIFNNKCSLDNVTLINSQTNEMDSIMVLVVDSIDRYYKKQGTLEVSKKLHQSIEEWKDIREKLSFLYVKNFEIGTSRGIQEAAYRRDLTKQFLISIVPIIRLIPG